MASSLRLTLVCALLLLAPLVGAQCSLVTTYAFNGGQSGMMFDLIAQNPAGIEVTGFDTSLDPGTWNIEVYAVTGGGTWQGNAQNPAAWTLIDTFPGIISNGQFVPTPLPPLVSGGGPNGGVVIPVGATQGFYVTCSNGTGMNRTLGTNLPTTFASNADLVFNQGSSNVYPFGSFFTPRIWNGTIHYTYPGQVTEFDTNTPTAAADISGVIGDACVPALLQRALVACPGGSVTQVAETFNMSSAGNPGALFDVAADLILGASLQPATAGGVVLPLNGAVVNLRLLNIAFINGGNTPLMLPMPAGPGAGTRSFTIPFSPAGTLDFAIQGIVTNPVVAGGFELTQASEYHATTQAPPTSIPGPTLDDQVVTFDPAANPTCWLPGPWTLYGSTFTQMHVDSNGRLMGVFDASDFSPTLAEALSGPPTLGTWNDLSPNAGGSVNISTPSPGVIDVTWSAVPYFGLAGGSNTFTLEYDDGTGNLAIISDVAGGSVPFSSNLTSTGTAGNMFVGLTPGTLGPGTDPGIVNGGLGFTPGGAGLPAAGTDMLYDFLDTTAPGAPNLPVSFNGTTLLRIDFLPATVGGIANYAWSGT